jgi:hypothetical protein
MLNIPDVGYGLGQEPKEEAEAVNTIEGMGMGSSRRRRCILRRGEPISWRSKCGENQYREVSKFSTHVTILCAAIRIIWFSVLRQKTLNAWLDLAEHQKVLAIKMLNSVTSKYARFEHFAEQAAFRTVKLEPSSELARVMLATSIIAGGV